VINFIRIDVYKILSHPVPKKGTPHRKAPATRGRAALPGKFRDVRFFSITSQVDRLKAEGRKENLKSYKNRMLQPSVFSLATCVLAYIGITEMVMGQGYEPGFAFSARMKR